MPEKVKKFFFKNTYILGLIFLIIVTILISSYENYKKNLEHQKNINFIDNVYLKKTLNEIINNLQPRYKIYNHKINV